MLYYTILLCIYIHWIVKWLRAGRDCLRIIGRSVPKPTALMVLVFVYTGRECQVCKRLVAGAVKKVVCNTVIDREIVLYYLLSLEDDILHKDRE